MKKTLTIVLLLAITSFSFSQQKPILEKPYVDKRVELLSIVFRLAGKPEYSSTYFKLYTDRIESHFEKYKNHELIQFAKENLFYKVGYDAIMSMAIHLNDDLSPISDVADNSIDQRWSNEDASKFILLLNKFYKDAECEKFFAANAELFSKTREKFMPIYEQIDLDWYIRFFGKEPVETFNIINALGTGGGNYGPKIIHSNGNIDIYSILGAWQTDSLGMLEYRIDDYLPLVIHEFNHSFVNYLTDNNKELFSENGKYIFSLLKDEMKSMAYSNWETILNEALVRAAVIKYMKDHNYTVSKIDEEIKTQMGLGFLWINELVDELDKYDEQRNTYANLEQYIPKLAEAYARFSHVAVESNSRRPIVTSIDEFNNEDTTVDANIKSITVNFNKPLVGEGKSFQFSNRGPSAYPKIESVTYANDNMSVVISVILEKDKIYDFIMTGAKFRTVDGLGIRRHEIRFKTSK